MRLLRVLFVAFLEAERQVFGDIEEGDCCAKGVPPVRGIAGQARNEARTGGWL